MDEGTIIRLRKVIFNLLVARGHSGTFSDTEMLFTSGLLDSLAGTEVMLTLESDFGVDLADPDFDVASLDTFAGIVAVVDHSVSMGG
jgi:acyl carrier protein